MVKSNKQMLYRAECKPVFDYEPYMLHYKLSDT